MHAEDCRGLSLPQVQAKPTAANVVDQFSKPPRMRRVLLGVEVQRNREADETEGLHWSPRKERSFSQRLEQPVSVIQFPPVGVGGN